MAQLISQQFQTALCYLLKKEGRGAQSRLSVQMGIDKGYLNGIIKGRKPGSEAVRGKIAAFFGTTYEDMLILGRQLLEGKKVEGPAASTTDESEIQGTHSTDEKSQSTPKADLLSLKKKQQTASPQSLPITELIKKTTDILEPNTETSLVLAQMIEMLHDSTRKDQKNQEQENQIKEMGERIENLEKLVSENNIGQRKFA